MPVNLFGLRDEMTGSISAGNPESAGPTDRFEGHPPALESLAKVMMSPVLIRTSCASPVGCHPALKGI